ncbi:MAG: ABC transporter permease [Planctomycetes bacterium]|nr:ABC transporter permease [Planctomycetota bacterium]
MAGGEDLLERDPGNVATAEGTGSALGAWCYLVWLCIQRQARARQMVWIALALLGFTTTVVALVSATRGWGMHHHRWAFEVYELVPGPTAGSRLEPFPPLAEDFPERRDPPPRIFRDPSSSPSIPSIPPGKYYYRNRWISLTYEEILDELATWPAVLQIWPAPAGGVESGIVAVWRAVLDRTGVLVFSNVVVFTVFLSFLLPIWSLSFATETLGGEREAGTLVWLLTRPLSRPAIYLAKYVALLPWSLGLNLGGFAILCLAAGKAGTLAFRWYWPAVFWATLTFAALFHLMSACFRRPAVVAIVYSFFLESLLGNMPGYLKRISISYYTRCLMFEPLNRFGISSPERESVYLPVSGAAAWWVLVGATVVLLAAGMVVFARTQYQDLS